jgi:hypothetical protein
MVRSFSKFLHNNFSSIYLSIVSDDVLTTLQKLRSEDSNDRNSYSSPEKKDLFALGLTRNIKVATKSNLRNETVSFVIIDTVILASLDLIQFFIIINYYSVFS